MSNLDSLNKGEKSIYSGSGTFDIYFLFVETCLHHVANYLVRRSLKIFY